MSTSLSLPTTNESAHSSPAGRTGEIHLTGNNGGDKDGKSCAQDEGKVDLDEILGRNFYW